MLSVSFYIASTPVLSLPLLTSPSPPYPSLPSHSSFYCVRIQLELKPDCPSFGDIVALPLVVVGAHLTITCVCYLEQIFPAWRTEHKKRKEQRFLFTVRMKGHHSFLAKRSSPWASMCLVLPQDFLLWIQQEEELSVNGWGLGGFPGLVERQGVWYKLLFIEFTFTMMHLILIRCTSSYAEAKEHGH